MFSENEVATLAKIPEIAEKIQPLKQEFVETEASYMDISDHDFLALILMTPSVGVALANGSVSLFEELALNKMARRMSLGGFFLKMDPVVHAMNLLIKSFDQWEDRFFDIIRFTMDMTMDKTMLEAEERHDFEDEMKMFAYDLMTVPHIFVNFLNSFVLSDESLTVGLRSISRVEFEKLQDIGERLRLMKYPVFHTFLNTFEVK
jgi:hypothetical protein